MLNCIQSVLYLELKKMALQICNVSMVEAGGRAVA